MLVVLNKLKESKGHWFEIELYKDNGSVQLQLLESKVSESLQEIINFIIELDDREKLSYRDLELNYNNKKVKNIRNLNDLISSIEENKY